MTTININNEEVIMRSRSFSPIMPLGSRTATLRVLIYIAVNARAARKSKTIRAILNVFFMMIEPINKGLLEIVFERYFQSHNASKSKCLAQKMRRRRGQRKDAEKILFLRIGFNELLQVLELSL